MNDRRPCDMNTVSSIATNGPDLRAQKLVASYVRAGYARIDPPVLQPAEPFLDLSGEDIRRRMFLTSDPHGRELCLRPDLTIPVARDYLQSPAAGKAAGFCYLGPVFRHREGCAEEFLQAGIESFAPHRYGGGRCGNAGARARGDRAYGWPRRKSASATSPCSPPWSLRSILRRRGSGG